jgi:nucleoporin NUP159
MNEERLIVSTANDTGLHCFRLADVLRGQTTPYHSFTANIPSQLIDLLPSPAVELPSRLVALLAKEGMVLADIEEKRLLEPIAGPFTSGKLTDLLYRHR